MTEPKSMVARLLDILLPRTCCVCGRRLSMKEQILCCDCEKEMPRTHHTDDTKSNAMAQLFWHLVPIEHAAALFYYRSGSKTASIIYKLKYNDRPDIGEYMGVMLARELSGTSVLEDVDMIVPVPLTRSRRRQRGYNQSEKIACGLAGECGKPVLADVLIRTSFSDSQTSKGRWDRMANVSNAFECSMPEAVRGKHILVVDDVVTTGATTRECAEVLVQSGARCISIVSLGFTKN